jgi:hypothetical protein
MRREKDKSMESEQIDLETFANNVFAHAHGHAGRKRDARTGRRAS